MSTHTHWITRAEKPGTDDVSAIRAIDLAAFDTPLEADLVEALRADADAWIDGLSIVAAAPGGELAGHALPTRCHIGDTPALIVSTTGDTATTYRGSRAMHHLLTGSRLLTLEGAIAHGVYGEYGDACVDGTVNAYLVSGRLPAGDPTCRNRQPTSAP